MSAFSEFSTTPSANTTIGGLNADEGCAAANVNNILRFIVAAGKELYNLVSAIDVSTFMPKSGGSFTGTIGRASAGGYWYHASSSQATGQVYTQPVATALPSSPAEGTVVLQY